MLKILLVYDDFQELTSVELMLKKIGFDVVGITSEFSLAEQLLSFNPQVVVAQGRTAKVSTANVGRRLRESVRWDGQSILIFYPNAKPQPTELLKIRMDVGLEYPVEPTKMVQVLAQLGSLDPNSLLDKLIKSMAQDSVAATAKEKAQNQSKSDRESVYVSGGQVAPDSQRGIGGAAGTAAGARKSVAGENPMEAPDRNPVGGLSAEELSRQALSTSLEPQTETDLFGGTNAESETAKDPAFDLKTSLDEDAKRLGGLSGDPVFPLEAKGNLSGEGGSQGVSGGSAGEGDPTGLTGTFGINPFPLDNMTQDPLMQELENLLQKKPDLSLTPPPIQDPERHKKYEEFMKTVPVPELASIKRREAKLRLKDMVKDIDKHELEDQDVLRREFVKALFKKEG